MHAEVCNFGIRQDAGRRCELARDGVGLVDGIDHHDVADGPDAHDEEHEQEKDEVDVRATTHGVQNACVSTPHTWNQAYTCANWCGMPCGTVEMNLSIQSMSSDTS